MFNGAFLHRGDCKTIVLTGKIRNSTWFAFSLAINFEVPVFRKMAAPASCHAVSRPKYIGPRLIQ